ncbi:MAG TPA: 2-isopropylmalate synthase [Polyangiaceae bacterium]|nr:2-isopropylmalate synthase [Polyangiaceae bacterium]
MSDRVIVFDTTLRDGEQSAGVLFTERDKLDIAEKLASMRVDVIEAGFPAASPAELHNVQAVAKQLRQTGVCGLARCVPGDVDAAAEALSGAANPRIHLFLNASDVQLEHQLRRTRAEALELAATMVARARKAVGEVEFSPMDATRADRPFLAELVRVAVKAGARTINIPDTVGYALPSQVQDLFEWLRRTVPELEDAVLSFHGQNDLGMASANAIAAVMAGARQVELCVNGIGERAGNTSFEEVVMAIAVHGKTLGVHTNVDATGICPLSKLVEERSGLAVPPNKGIVGRNAFRHASGIHQDGVLKHRQNFECIDPTQIGHATGTEIVLGKLSGNAGFTARCRALGLEMPPPVAARAFRAFQALADRKREVFDEDVRALVARATAEGSGGGGAS